MDYLEFIARVTIPVVDFVVLGVLFLFSCISRGSLMKMGRNGEKVHKGNTCNFERMSGRCHKNGRL